MRLGEQDLVFIVAELSSFIFARYYAILLHLLPVEDEKHSDFVHLRQFLTRTHLQDLIETTHYLHYEQFRTRQLLALKEGGGAALAAQQQQNSTASLVSSSMPIPPPTNPSPGQ